MCHLTVTLDILVRQQRNSSNRISHFWEIISDCSLCRLIPGSNYFPYRPEINLGFERDYKSYPDYAYDRTTNYFNDRGNRWDYLSNTGIARTTAPFTNTSASPGQRRQFSNTASNVNPSFHLERDELDAIYQLNDLNIEPIKSLTNRMHVYENVPQRRLSQSNYQEFSDYGSSSLQQSSQPPADRPMSLPFDQQCGSKLRSSLKKYGSNARPSTAPTTMGTTTVTTKNGCTPTNPTPPDSLTSDDSSYLSAREGSISSQSRVRFSPEALHEQSALSHGQQLHPLDASALGQQQQQQSLRRLSRTRRSVGNEPSAQS